MIGKRTRRMRRGIGGSRDLFLDQGPRLLLSDCLETFLAQAADGVGVRFEVLLGPDQDHGGSRTMSSDFREPLGGNILEGGRGDEGEAKEEDIGLRIGEGAQTVVVLLTCRIPEPLMTKSEERIHVVR